MSPSCVPSSVPSGQPSGQPTSQPSSQPTTTPTSSPSLQFYFNITDWQKKYVTSKQLLVNENVGTKFVYGEFFHESIRLDGGCGSWNGFIASLDEALRSSQASVAMDYIEVSELTHPITWKRCRSPVSTQSFITSISENANAFTTQPPYDVYGFQCHSNNWKVKRCADESSVAICQNCYDPCKDDDPLYTNNPANRGASAFRMNPCENRGDDHKIRMLTVTFKGDVGKPSIDNVVVNPSSTYADIHVNLSYAGTQGFVYCAVVPMGGAVTNYTSFDIVRNGMMVSSSNFTAVIQMRDLLPSTQYMAHCFATGFNEVSISAYQVITITGFKTNCCKEIDVDLYYAKYYYDMDTNNAYIPNFFGVRLYHIPYDYVDISLSMHAASCSISPSKLRIAPSNFSTERVYKVGVIGCSIGTHMIAANVGGALASDYRINYPLGRSFEILDPDLSHYSSLLAAEFSSNLRTIVFRFDLPVDLTIFSSSEFQCSLIFSFLGANETECVWADESNVHAFMDTSSIGKPTWDHSSTLRVAWAHSGSRET